MLKLDSASITLANIRQGHGIFINVDARKDYSTLIGSQDSIFIDLYGGIFNAMPAGMGSVAQFFLPYKLKHFPKAQANVEGKSASLKIGIGIQQLSHETFKNNLQKIIDNGDPVFVIEFIFNNTNKVLVEIPTKASLIKSTLDNNGGSIIYHGQMPVFKRRGNTFKIIRWWFNPILYLIAIWGLLFNPSFFLNMVPQIYAPQQKTIEEVLPPHPKKMSEAWELGQYNIQCYQAEKQNNDNLVSQILINASKILGKQSITAIELHKIIDSILEMENNMGIITRVRGFFTLINTIWLLAIIGITVSVGPTLYILLKPIRMYLKRLILEIFNRFIIPTIDFLHRNGFFELFCYIICFGFILEGYRMYKTSGEFVTLSGLTFVVPAFGYSTLLHSKKIRAEINEETLTKMTSSWLALCWCPMAIHYNSILLGYMTVMALYTVLGFSFACYGLCYCIGFDSKDGVKRVCATSIIMLFIYTALRICRIHISFLEPFTSAVNILGCFTLYLGLLIISYKYYHGYYHQSRTEYIKRQVYMIIALLVGSFVGLIYNIEGMSNTALTFLVFYVIEKYTEFHFDHEYNGWVFVFIISVVAYKCALWLHHHPEFIVSMFSHKFI